MQVEEILLGRGTLRPLPPRPGVSPIVGNNGDECGNRYERSFDIRTVAIMSEYGVRRIYTFDADFQRFSEIAVLDPALGFA